VRSDMRPGRVFPDYSWPGDSNIVLTLSELQGDNPMILTLARQLLSEGTPAAPGVRSELSENRRRLYPGRQHRHR
jgi:hypothetical protein